MRENSPYDVSALRKEFPILEREINGYPAVMPLMSKMIIDVEDSEASIAIDACNGPRTMVGRC